MPERMEREPMYGNGKSIDSESTICADWGALLPDAAEDLLGEIEAQALGRHVAGCAACATELAEARRGAAWLSLLKGQAPEPPRDMVAGILARTSGAEPWVSAREVSPLLPAGDISQLPIAPQPAYAWFAGSEGALSAAEPRPLRRWLARWLGMESPYLPALHPRLTMTAAMAFFSICLTLNMLGATLRHLPTEDLHAAELQRTVAGKGATILRSVEGSRMVYRVESRVNEWLTAGTPTDGRGARQQ